jgi:hypothetical protein
MDNRNGITNEPDDVLNAPFHRPFGIPGPVVPFPY